MARPQYRLKSRESLIMERVANNMQRVVNRAVQDNPLPIGEQRIDPRTARKRLEQIPPDQLHEYLRQLG